MKIFLLKSSIHPTVIIFGLKYVDVIDVFLEPELPQAAITVIPLSQAAFIARIKGTFIFLSFVPIDKFAIFMLYFF